MISYNPLWHTLINNGMNKGDLMEKTGISYGTMASMGKNEPVNLKQIDRICKALNCGISDVIIILTRWQNLQMQKVIFISGI